MKFRHRDGAAAAAGSVSIGLRQTASVDEDGVFEIPDDHPDADALAARLEDAGHDRLDANDPAPGDTGDDDAGDDVDDAEAESEPPQASDYSETELVEMDRPALRGLAAHYDHINGNGTEDELTEELIEQRREEVGDQ